MSPIEVTGKYYTTKEVAKLTGKSLGSIQKHCQAGRLGAQKIGGTWFIPVEGLEERIKNLPKPGGLRGKRHLKRMIAGRKPLSEERKKKMQAARWPKRE